MKHILSISCQSLNKQQLLLYGALCEYNVWSLLGNLIKACPTPTLDETHRDPSTIEALLNT